MDQSGIVYGPSTPEKRVRARELRQEMTPAEETLWQRLRTNRLAGLHFRRQQVIDGFVADFYCHAAGLVIEVDGSAHDGRAAYDGERDAVLKTRGLRVLRFHNARVLGDIESVLAEILTATIGFDSEHDL